MKERSHLVVSFVVSLFVVFLFLLNHICRDIQTLNMKERNLLNVMFVVHSAFFHKYRLKLHTASVHEGKKPFKCDICDTAYVY